MQACGVVKWKINWKSMPVFVKVIKLRTLSIYGQFQENLKMFPSLYL